jgi:hypothetical protein
VDISLRNKNPALKKSRPKQRRPRETSGSCQCCKAWAAFLWTCKCGFAICQECMLDNTWGLTCNHVTWTCPDCGELRSY